MLLALAGHAWLMYPCPFLIDNQEACRYNANRKAGVAQLVEYKLPKLGVAGSRPVARSIIQFKIRGCISRIFSMCTNHVHHWFTITLSSANSGPSLGKTL
jgi:hypothetical protein